MFLQFYLLLERYAQGSLLRLVGKHHQEGEKRLLTNDEMHNLICQSKNILYLERNSITITNSRKVNLQKIPLSKKNQPVRISLSAVKNH